jgi:hypothetical protein
VSYQVPYRLICRGCGHTSTGVCSTETILPEPHGWACPDCGPLVVTLADVDGGGIIQIKDRPPHVVAIRGFVMPTGPTHRDRKRQQARMNSGKARVTIRGTPRR